MSVASPHPSHPLSRLDVRLLGDSGVMFGPGGDAISRSAGYDVHVPVGDGLVATRPAGTQEVGPGASIGGCDGLGQVVAEVDHSMACIRIGVLNTNAVDLWDHKAVAGGQGAVVQCEKGQSQLVLTYNICRDIASHDSAKHACGVGLMGLFTGRRRHAQKASSCARSTRAVFGR